MRMRGGAAGGERVTHGGTQPTLRVDLANLKRPTITAAMGGGGEPISLLPAKNRPFHPHRADHSLCRVTLRVCRWAAPAVDPP